METQVAKQRFCEGLHRLKELYEKEQAINKAVQALDPDFNFFCLSSHDSLIVRLLDALIEVELQTTMGEWVGWWAWERNFGRERPYMKCKCGAEYICETPEILWDAVMCCRKNPLTTKQ